MKSNPARERERQSALRALEGLSPRELTNEQQLDRLALRSLLLKECEDYARGRHALEPNAPDQRPRILLHCSQREHSHPQRVFVNNLLRSINNFLLRRLPVAAHHGGPAKADEEKCFD